jgi:peptidoglycan/xylan/chitin deacetylase (PgdA/CDA1 family)
VLPIAPGTLQRRAAGTSPGKNDGMKRITITFDNGPTPGVTERVLDALAKRDIRSSFFVIGQQLRDKRALGIMHEAQAAGHWIGNHSLTHAVGLGERPTAEFAHDDIGGAQALIGHFPDQEKLFRPFGKLGLLGPHLFSEASLHYLCEQYYTTVIWNSVPRDWEDADGWVERCLSDAAQQDWTVVALHDIEDACAKRLPELLLRLEDAGIAIEQQFPESVVVTRNGRIVTLAASNVSDRLPGQTTPAY